MSISHALLVSADAEAIQHCSFALQELSISPDVCREVPLAIRLLNRQKFEAVIVDLQLGEHSGWVLDEVRLSASNRTAVIFAISGHGEESTVAFRSGAGFVFERPLSARSIRRILRPAYGLILRERRRYFRCPISVPVVLLRPPLPELRCHSLNISEGGMAMSTSVPLKPGEPMQVHFTLPGHDTSYLAEATVRWWKAGYLGVCFVSLSKEDKSELQVWLARKLEELLPATVADTFQKADRCSIPILGAEN